MPHVAKQTRQWTLEEPLGCVLTPGEPLYGQARAVGHPTQLTADGVLFGPRDQLGKGLPDERVPTHLGGKNVLRGTQRPHRVARRSVGGGLRQVQYSRLAVRASRQRRRAPAKSSRACGSIRTTPALDCSFSRGQHTDRHNDDSDPLPWIRCPASWLARVVETRGLEPLTPALQMWNRNRL